MFWKSHENVVFIFSFTQFDYNNKHMNIYSCHHILSLIHVCHVYTCLVV